MTDSGLIYEVKFMNPIWVEYEYYPGGLIREARIYSYEAPATQKVEALPIIEKTYGHKRIKAQKGNSEND